MKKNNTDFKQKTTYKELLPDFPNPHDPQHLNGRYNGHKGHTSGGENLPCDLVSGIWIDHLGFGMFWPFWVMKELKEERSHCKWILPSPNVKHPQETMV